MVHIDTEQSSAPSSQETSANAPPAKGDAWIMAQLRQVLSYRRALPAFSHGQIFYDYNLGKVRIAEAPNPAA